MAWLNILIIDGDKTIEKMINADNYKSIEADPGDDSQIILTHNDGNTITAAADFTSAKRYFAPLLYKKDLLGNAL